MKKYIYSTITKYNSNEKEEIITNELDLIPYRRKSFYGKAKVLITYQYDYLLSYNTLIARINVDNGKIERLTNTRTNTTSSHILTFLKDNNINITINEFYKLPLKEL